MGFDRVDPHITPWLKRSSISRKATVIDLDLEKFFDRVNHDKLMGHIAKRIEDKRLLKLIRAFLNAGVMENGLVGPSVEGTPQGGPLSPLLITSCSTNSTGSWSAADIALFAMRTTVTFTFAANARVNG
jgi:Reverse transcriptase (RNA-dependent DNA polymerase)